MTQQSQKQSDLCLKLKADVSIIGKVTNFDSTNFEVQVSLNIRWGYVPDKYQIANTKITILSLNQTKNSCFPDLFEVFTDVHKQSKLQNKTINSKCHL